MQGERDIVVRAARTAIQSGGLEEAAAALDTLRQLVADHGDTDGSLHLQIGLALVRLGRRDEAIESLGALLARPPAAHGEARLQARLALARIRIGMGDDSAAEAELRRAVEENPRSIDGHLQLLRFLGAHGRTDDARAAVTAALEESGVAALLAEIGLLRADSSPDCAVETLAAVTTVTASEGASTGDSRVATRLAEAREKQGESRAAAEIYATLARGPDVALHFHYHERAARLFRSAGDAATADAHLTQARSLVPRVLRSTAPPAAPATGRDCPLLPPQKFRGKRNEPSYVRYAAAEIANVHSVSLEEVNEATSRNARARFGLPA